MAGLYLKDPLWGRKPYNYAEKVRFAVSDEGVGTRLFLVMDPNDKTVEVFTTGPKVVTYSHWPLGTIGGENRGLPAAGALGVTTAIPVAQILQGIHAGQES